MEKSIIRFLHISDIHFRKDNKNQFEIKLIRPFLEYMKKEITKSPIDFICLTGDLIDKGNGGYSNSTEAFNEFRINFIDKICSELRFNPMNIIMCPGNHDMNKDLDSLPVEKGYSSYLNTPEIIDSFMSNAQENNNFEGIKRTEPYKDFERNYYPNEKDDISIFETTHIRNFEGYSIGFTCLNSAWRYYDKDKDLLIGERQLLNSMKKNKSCDLQIVLSHYPLEDISEIERKTIENLLTENYQFMFFGHNHSEDSKCIQPSSGGSYFSSISRGLIHSNTNTKNIDYINGFSIIEYDFLSSKIKHYPIIYSQKINQYVMDTTSVGNKGYSEFILTDNKDEIKQLHNISEGLRKHYVDSLNEDLITSGCDTIAPQSLEELFVQPRLLFPKKEKEENEHNIELIDLVIQDKNYVILGVKETGKTLCLDYLSKVLIENINKYKTIPVYIDLKSTHINKWETKINNFLGIGIKDVDRFLTENKVILLLDNINFNNEYTIKSLIELIQKYPKLKFIGTVQNEFEGNIPLDFAQSTLYELVSIVELKYFTTKQIRELTNNWFKNSENNNTKEKQDKIVKLISSLELPRTPLSISMFLWILEKQEDYQPVNQAIILESFIEKMFNKHDIRQAHYNEFNYKNKEYLLASIAKEMLEKDQDNYSILYTGLISFTSNYLKNKSWPYNAKEIIDEFVEVGVFTKYLDNTDEYVRFRFNCFFQYFLMKNIDDDSNFRTYIMKEENYLSFSDEIILYTGLNTNQEEILKTIVDRMNLLYKELLTDISKLEKSYDSFFDNDISFTDSIEEKEIKELSVAKRKMAKDFDKIKDQYLEATPVAENIEKKVKKMSLLKKLEISLILAANVLRNSEEIKGNKDDYFIDILRNSLGFVCLYKYLYYNTIRNKINTLNKDQKKETALFIHCLPLLHEALLEDMLATSKLSLVYKNHIENIMDDKNITQLEKYCSVFLYADTKGKNYLSYVKRLIKQIKGSYIKDMIFFKLTTYYFLRDDNATIEKQIELLLADILTYKDKRKRFKISKIMANYRAKKKQYLLDSNK